MVMWKIIQLYQRRYDEINAEAQMDRNKLKTKQEQFRGKSDFNSKFDNRKNGQEMSDQIINSEE